MCLCGFIWPLEPSRLSLCEIKLGDRVMLWWLFLVKSSLKQWLQHQGKLGKISMLSLREKKVKNKQYRILTVIFKDVSGLSENNGFTRPMNPQIFCHRFQRNTYFSWDTSVKLIDLVFGPEHWEFYCSDVPGWTTHRPRAFASAFPHSGWTMYMVHMTTVFWD